MLVSPARIFGCWTEPHTKPCEEGGSHWGGVFICKARDQALLLPFLLISKWDLNLGRQPVLLTPQSSGHSTPTRPGTCISSEALQFSAKYSLIVPDIWSLDLPTCPEQNVFFFFRPPSSLIILYKLGNLPHWRLGASSGCSVWFLAVRALSSECQGLGWRPSFKMKCPTA